MASKRDRQRKLERARAERRLARQAHRVRRRRQIQAGIGSALALILIVLGVTWALGGFDEEPKPTVASGTCTWYLKDPATDDNVVDTGHPPTTGEPRSGTAIMTIATNLGDIVAEIDLSRAPCTAASFKYLGEHQYYEKSRCHRLSMSAHLLQCGDATGTGSGSPSYYFADEDLPSTPLPDPSASPTPSATATPSASATASASPSPTPRQIYYPKGTIAMANAGVNTNGGQFYIFYDDSDLSPAYSVVGKITKGLSIVEEIAKGGARNSEGSPVDDGNPVRDLIIDRLTVAYPNQSPSTSPSASPSASPSSSPSPSPKS